MDKMKTKGFNMVLGLLILLVLLLPSLTNATELSTNATRSAMMMVAQSLADDRDGQDCMDKSDIVNGYQCDDTIYYYEVNNPNKLGSIYHSRKDNPSKLSISGSYYLISLQGQGVGITKDTIDPNTLLVLHQPVAESWMDIYKEYDSKVINNIGTKLVIDIISHDGNDGDILRLTKLIEGNDGFHCRTLRNDPQYQRMSNMIEPCTVILNNNGDLQVVTSINNVGKDLNDFTPTSLFR